MDENKVTLVVAEAHPHAEVIVLDSDEDADVSSNFIKLDSSCDELEVDEVTAEDAHDEMKISDNMRAPSLPGQLIASITDNDDIYEKAIYVQGIRLSLLQLKTLELVYDEDEICNIQCQLWTGDNFRPSILSIDIIDTLLSLICKEFCNTHFIPCNTVKVWLLGKPLNEHRSKSLPSAASLVLLPVEINQSDHILLLVYSVNLNVFRIIDSKPGLEDDIREKVIDIRNHFKAEYCIPQASDALITYELGCQQTNSLDSAVFLLHNAEMCAKNLPISTHFDPILKRADLLKKLVDESN